MARALYFDCFAGASGDMIVGALLDLGLELPALEAKLAGLKLDGYALSAEKVTRSGIAATKFVVKIAPGPHPHRGLQSIKTLIEESALDAKVKADSIRVFEALGRAEAKAHGQPLEDVHFHEVGAVDSIVDIVGTCIALHLLGVEQMVASPLRVGSGTVETEHGLLPIPAPGTAGLLGGVPVYAGEIQGEFLTPTGAALLTSFCSFGVMPPMKIERTGYGAGSREYPGLPNVLRAIIGESTESGAAPGTPQWGENAATLVTVIETNIDDLNPQTYGYVFQRAFDLGALDVFVTSVQMKKDRPGSMLTVLSQPNKMDALITMLMEETTTLGVRYYEANRQVLARTIETVDTKYGPLRIKVARRGETVLHFQPEYDDCARAAKALRIPLIEVESEAAARYRALADQQTRILGKAK